MRELVEAGVLYLGASAGAIVAGSTAQTARARGHPPARAACVHLSLMRGRRAVWTTRRDDKTMGGRVDPSVWGGEGAKGLDLAGGLSFFPGANGVYSSREWQKQQA